MKTNLATYLLIIIQIIQAGLRKQQTRFSSSNWKPEKFAAKIDGFFNINILFEIENGLIFWTFDLFEWNYF